MVTALLIVFAGLSLCDVWSTYDALRLGAWEVNPVARWLIETLGLLPGLLVMKGAGIGALLVLNHFYPLAEGVLWFIDAGYVALLFWNYSQIKKQKA